MSHGRLESCSVMWSTSALSTSDCIVVVGGPGGVNYVIQVVLQAF